MESWLLVPNGKFNIQRDKQLLKALVSGKSRLFPKIYPILRQKGESMLASHLLPYSDFPHIPSVNGSNLAKVSSYIIYTGSKATDRK